ncbi:MAG: branched-chain amino acid ABC transporter permease [Acidimicrobiia bacterium]
MKWVTRPQNVGVLAVGGLLFGGLAYLAADNPTKFFQNFVAGLSLGAIYALVCLGFVIIYRATGLLNFAQVGLVVLGAFVAYNGVATWKLGWWLSLVLAAAVCGAVGFLFQRFVMRNMSRAPGFSQILATIGLFLFLQAVVDLIWGGDSAGGNKVANPWGLTTFQIGDVTLLRIDAVTIGLAALLLFGFFVLFRFTPVGLSMRAAAIDPEAALAQGISVNRVVALSWVIGGVAAAIAGTMLGSGSTPLVGLNAAFIALVGLRAFPAMIVGGLDSPGGAVVGGLLIGVIENLARAYEAQYFPALGGQFPSVLPYLVMIAVLLIRPYGLFGTPEVRRI